LAGKAGRQLSGCAGTLATNVSQIHVVITNRSKELDPEKMAAN
jgi:hypothetical protein